MIHRLEEFEAQFVGVATRIRAALECITDESLDQPGFLSSDSQDSSLGQLAWHLVTSLSSILGQLGINDLCPSPNDPMPREASQLVAAWDSVVGELGRRLPEEIQDVQLGEIAPIYGLPWTRAQTLQAIIDHLHHHLGQVVILLRQAGIRPPDSLGPAGDFETQRVRLIPFVQDLGDENPRPLPEAARKWWTIQAVIESVFLVGGTFAAEWFWLRDQEWAPPFGIAIGVAVVHSFWSIWWLVPRSFARWKWHVRGHDVLLTHGVLFHTQRSVPRPRIQHVDISSGPIMRRFGLVRCTLFTAGGGQSASEIPAMLGAEAEQLRERLLNRDQA